MDFVYRCHFDILAARKRGGVAKKITICCPPFFKHLLIKFDNYLTQPPLWFMAPYLLPDLTDHIVDNTQCFETLFLEARLFVPNEVPVLDKDR